MVAGGRRGKDDGKQTSLASLVGMLQSAAYTVQLSSSPSNIAIQPSDSITGTEPRLAI